MKLSLWLRPAAQDAPALSALIERCAMALGSPTFPPHITLGTEPARVTLADPASSTQLPLALTLATPGFGSDFFHGCYLQLRDDTAVVALQARCAAAFGTKPPEKYPPHLSLSYGVLSAQQRQAVLPLIGALPLQAEFDRLELWDTSGPVAQWRKHDG